MNYSAIVLCAGKGTRTGLTYNKIFYKIDNKTVYERTMQIFLRDKECKQIIVVAKHDEQEQLKQLIENVKIEFIEGGAERQDSVYNGLQLVTQKHVMIHDGARPYVSMNNIHDIKEELLNYDACLLMVPCKDTIKVVNDGHVEKTLERSTLMQAQTPQAFKTEIIKEAYQKAANTSFQATDDCSLVEQFMECKIKVILGSYQNSKITTMEDL